MILLVFDIFVSMTLLALIANSSNAGDANFAQGHINSCIPWIIIFLDIQKTYHLLIIKKYIYAGMYSSSRQLIVFASYLHIICIALFLLHIHPHQLSWPLGAAALDEAEWPLNIFDHQHFFNFSLSSSYMSNHHHDFLANFHIHV